MVQYTASVRTVARVSERRYPFTEKEKRGGVFLDTGSKADQFWGFFVQTGDDLKDPLTGESMGTIEATERRAAAANDAYMDLNENYFHLMDAIEDYDEKLGNGVLSPGVSRTQMVRDADLIFQEMELSSDIVNMYEHSWFHYRDMRLLSLNNALTIHEDMLKEEKRDMPGDLRTNYPWWPSTELVSSIRSEVMRLKEGIRLSDRYIIQDTMQDTYGRPLFSKSELSEDGGFLVEDPMHRHPSNASLVERIAMVSLVR